MVVHTMGDLLKGKLDLARSTWPDLHYRDNIIALDITCPTCSEAFSDPVVLESGHKYCRGCVQPAGVGDRVKCAVSGKICSNVIADSGRNKIDVAIRSKEFIENDIKGGHEPTVCQECDHKSANLHCEGCDKWLCGNCVDELHPYPHDEGSLGADEAHINAASTATKIQESLKDTWLAKLSEEKEKLKKAVSDIDSQITNLNTDFQVETTSIEEETTLINEQITTQKELKLCETERFVERELAKMSHDRHRLLESLAVYNKGCAEVDPALKSLDIEGLVRGEKSSELLLLRRLQFAPTESLAPDWLEPAWESINVELQVDKAFRGKIESGIFKPTNKFATTKQEREMNACRDAQLAQRPAGVTFTDSGSTWPHPNMGPLRLANNEAILAKTKEAQQAAAKEKEADPEAYTGLQNPVAVSINTGSPTAEFLCIVEQGASLADVRKSIDAHSDRTKLPAEYQFHNAGEWIAGLGKDKLDNEGAVSIATHGPGGEDAEDYKADQGLYTLYVKSDDAGLEYKKIKDAQAVHRGGAAEDPWEGDKERVENNEKLLQLCTEAPEDQIAVGIAAEGAFTAAFTVLVPKDATLHDIRGAERLNVATEIPECYSFYSNTTGDTRTYAKGCGPDEQIAEAAVKITNFIVNGVCMLYVVEDEDKKVFKQLKGAQETKFQAAVALCGDIDGDVHKQYTEAQKASREDDSQRLANNNKIAALVTDDNIGVGVGYAGNQQQECLAVGKEAKVTELREVLKDAPLFYKIMNPACDAYLSKEEEGTQEVASYVCEGQAVVNIFIALDEEAQLKNLQDSARGEFVECKFTKAMDEGETDAARLEGNTKISTQEVAEDQVAVGLAYQGSPVIISVVAVAKDAGVEAVRKAAEEQGVNDDEQLPKSFCFVVRGKEVPRDEEASPASPVGGIRIAYLKEVQSEEPQAQDPTPEEDAEQQGEAAKPEGDEEPKPEGEEEGDAAKPEGDEEPKPEGEEEAATEEAAEGEKPPEEEAAAPEAEAEAEAAPEE
eukprot:TRINITY_DN6750_c0_g1_i1.p1 TRINITY_DN6750_c0_g1~~TRINITY_DN6750_c0_g1_i1.p1  ORF type:complete len:1025 (+),score=305.33 TRINITY_DN6750_c0_g1_i1:49-3075(+)